MPDIFVEQKVVFMHNPKCGSRNLRAISKQIRQQNPCQYIGALNDNQLLVVDRRKRERILKNVLAKPVSKELDYTWEHCSVKGIYKLFERVKIDPEGFRFVYVIRHPQDRLVSGYRYDLKRNHIASETTFSEYIFHNDTIPGAMPLNTHPIERFSEGFDGKQYLDHVVRLEDFEQGMRGVLTTLGFDIEGIHFDAWRHSSADFQLPTSVQYSEKELAFMSTLWAEDMRIGEYEMKSDYAL
jgi:hypothetical protein